MTLVESPDNQPSTHSPPDPRVRPHFLSSKPTLWLKTASMESLSSPGKPRTLDALKSASSSLKKRHSTFVLSPPPELPPTPNPPQRPLRNPARRDSGVSNTPTKHKSKKRPSTATGTPEQAVPWVPSSRNTNTSTTNIPGTSVGSFVSNCSCASLPGTGPVEEVTPWELYPVQATTSRHTLSTGPTEEVTPWELYPVSAPKRNRSSLATGLVEDVTPWELFPVPIPEKPVPSNERHTRSASRRSTSSGQGRSLSDLTQIRRLKHVSGKASKTRSNTLSPAVAQSSDQGWAAGIIKGAGSSGSVPPSPNLSQKAPSTTTSDGIRLSTTSQNPQFSTADRTILEELKRSITARAAQFTTKGAGIVEGCGVTRPGKKHHPYRREEVPYPRSYDREVLDLDVWETIFCQNLCESLTWHVFQTSPAKVLDLGCGTGTWILNSARSWRDSQFVGLDIVPLHPDLQQVGSPDLASRITWVQTNFLEGLPFPNEEFDFVHIKRIALGVPEDKWDFLLEEISRVMKPGGAFEMHEEDLFFPGKLLEDDSDSNSDHEFVSSQSSPRNSTVSDMHHERDGNDSTATRSRHSHDSGDDLTTTATTSTLPETPSRSGSPSIDVVINGEGGKDEARHLLYIDHPELAQPKKTEGTKASSPHLRSLDWLQPEVSSARLSYHSNPASSSTSLRMSSVTNVPPDGLSGNTVNSRPATRRRGYSLNASTPLPAPNVVHRLQNKSQVAINEIPKTPQPPLSKSSPFLLKTVPKPPVNPRDHSVLESIYTQMLESRFINTSPLALLANSLGVYFKDVRTHPPLQHAFPPKPRNPPSHLDMEYYSDGASDSDDARNAIFPRPRSNKTQRAPHSSSARSEESEPISEENSFSNVRGLLQRGSQYITLDDTQISSISPSTKITLRSITSAQTGKARRGSHLPNMTMNFDLKSLNLHLALRAAEILACSESMWEWILEHQRAAVAHRASKSGIRTVNSGSVDPSQKSLSSLSSNRNLSESVRNNILELTREDFNGLLSNFELDMRDTYSLGSALEDRFLWSIMASAPSAERKIFETACEKWDKWEYEHFNAPSSRPSRPNRRRPTTADTSRSAPQETKNYNRENDIMKRLSVSSGSAQLPQAHRLSRATRVFVAWKA
ncbi:hypothetical protein L208DRAFT_1398447 [Tricholoma matsutake]|nr:hypothetical protein L208DRAFT_1398447 [Tricholoma matsutake 945]